jgi:hypothetical protein
MCLVEDYVMWFINRKKIERFGYIRTPVVTVIEEPLLLASNCERMTENFKYFIC